jgi:hypothetical protein
MPVALKKKKDPTSYPELKPRRGGMLVAKRATLILFLWYQSLEWYVKMSFPATYSKERDER